MSTFKPSDAAVPVIDLLPALAGGDAAERVAAQIRQACEDIGFFYIANHGVDAGVIREAFAKNREFHALPLDRKMQVKRNRFHRGYTPVAGYTLKSTSRFAPAARPNQLEAFTVRHELAPDDPDLLSGNPLQGPNVWPEDYPEFKPAVQAYERELRALGMRLVGLMSRAIGAGPDYLAQFFHKPITSLRMIHYPPQPAPEEGSFGISPHTDLGFLTILAQDSVGGLEIQAKDGQWLQAPYREGTFVINIGDALARWTNDRYVSTAHRVLNRSPDRDRYSIAYFFDPSPDAVIECFEAFVDGRDSRYPPIRYGEYIAARMEANYAG
ncbi:isopenicillin N synthase family oxygenase [Verticiella sediminum]|uniref:2-oxoglutarate-dependent ethylene/succinate-forming enzyme n=1 Tax=Verticiella sediminum TaxID=1247510 RepID=A0A556A9A4_9BURK|nr:2-oxoglutarate and iron-dependent oxygenase domain-containing protein [Verticiella sediminum]TSH89451.1 isopenicillin N synthase family oxygenase [Verticiella sediminum]